MPAFFTTATTHLSSAFCSSPPLFIKPSSTLPDTVLSTSTALLWCLTISSTTCLFWRFRSLLNFFTFLFLFRLGLMLHRSLILLIRIFLLLFFRLLLDISSIKRIFLLIRDGLVMRIYIFLLNI